jgi:hypothetical protein
MFSAAFVFAALAASPPLFPSVVSDVPGRAASVHFSAEVFFEGAWTPAYVFETTGGSHTDYNGYFAHLTNWTHSWVSSQLAAADAPLLLRLRRIDGIAITSAHIHPSGSPTSVVNISLDGTLVLAATASARVAIDVNGAMDDHDTGPKYGGPLLHTFSWFVDAPSDSLPDVSSPSTLVVRPGDAFPPTLNASIDTVVFAPGVHRASAPVTNNWTIIEQPSSTRFFLCAGAVVHASIHSQKTNNLTIDGFGVLSGEDMSRPPGVNNSPKGVEFDWVATAKLTTFTLVDFPNHHLILGNGDTVVPNDLNNVKVLGWHANGDGLHVFRNWTVAALFMRTQDDSMYLACGKDCTTTFSQITTWNDANGCAFIFSAGGGDVERVSLSDSDAIYSRASWAYWSGGRVFCHRGATTGVVMSGVEIKDIRCPDRFPTLNAFQFDMTGDAGLSDASFADVTFTNIYVANWSTTKTTFEGKPLPFGIPNLLFAGPGKFVNFSSVAFNNVTIAGELMSTSFLNPSKWNLSSSSTLVNVTADGEPVRI